MTAPWSFCCSLLGFLPLLLRTHHTAHAAPDFSRYLQSILRNQTAHACEGSTLLVHCPSRTSVAVLSAFYGRRVPNRHLCPSARNTSVDEEDTECSSPVAVEKVVSECQDRQSCHIPVLSAVFGQDPCPNTSKYLLVSFKCRPEHHRTRLVCENERLRLTCKNHTVLAIYSASFGHLLHGSPHCPQEPASHTDMECVSSLALRKVSRRCHGRANCSVVADTHTFGDPCFPGTRKHLRVSFTCVPQYLLEDVGRGSTDPFLISDYTHGGWYTGPIYRPHNVLFTNSLEIFEKMWDFPEKVALYFVSGICAGLFFLLCLFSLRSTFVRDVKELVSDLRDEIRTSRRRREELMEDLFDDQISDTSSFCRLTKSQRSGVDVDVLGPHTLTLEMADRGVEQMRELPNGDMWPHRDSSPYAIHKIQTYNNF